MRYQISTACQCEAGVNPGGEIGAELLVSHLLQPKEVDMHLAEDSYVWS
jgi:hypothetical protein